MGDSRTFLNASGLTRDVLVDVLAPMLDYSSYVSFALAQKELSSILSFWSIFPEFNRYKSVYVRKCEAETAVHWVASLLVSAVRRGHLAQFRFFIDYFYATEKFGGADILKVYSVLIERNRCDEAERFLQEFGGFPIFASASMMVNLGLSGSVETVEWFFKKWNRGKPYESTQLTFIIIGAASGNHVKLLAYLFERTRAAIDQFVNHEESALIACLSEDSVDALQWLLENRELGHYFQSRFLNYPPVPRSLHAFQLLESNFEEDHPFLDRTGPFWMKEWAKLGAVELVKLGLSRRWPIDDSVRLAALKSGNLQLIQLIGFPNDKFSILSALKSGSLDVVSFLWREQGEPSLGADHFNSALRAARLKRQGTALLRWLIDHKCWFDIAKAFESYLFFDVEEGKVALTYCNPSVLDFLLALDPSFLTGSDWTRSFLLSFGYSGMTTRYGDGCRPVSSALKWFLSKLSRHRIISVLLEIHYPLAPYLGNNYVNLAASASARGDRDTLELLFDIIHPDDEVIGDVCTSAISAGNCHILKYLFLKYGEQLSRFCNSKTVLELILDFNAIDTLCYSLEWLIGKKILKPDQRSIKAISSSDMDKRTKQKLTSFLKKHL